MPIIHLLVVLVIIGVILYVLNAVVSMDGKIKTIINAVVIVAVLLWLLSLFTGMDFGYIGPHHR
jgi:hypothetical protein